MSDIKKYYYLKLKDNFFESDELIILESMPDGYLYVNILFKLYLKSLKNEGKLMFKETIPYNTQMLAQVVRHSVGVVEKAIDIFKKLELIEILDNGAIYILEIQNFIGESSSEGDRKRRYRAKIKAEKIGIETNVWTNVPQITDDRPPEIRDKRLKIRDNIKEKINKKEKKDTITPTRGYVSNEKILSVVNYYNSISRIQFNSQLKTNLPTLNNLQKLVNDYSLEDIKSVIDFVLTDKWHKDNGFIGLSVISRPTKFLEKLERVKASTIKSFHYYENDENRKTSQIKDLRDI